MAEQVRHAVGFHQGSVLWHLADTYPTLMKALIEMVQNSIDACASRVFIGIDQRAHRVVVMDDGVGITVEHFKRALDSIGMTIKDDPDALGRFGLGMISPFPKCRMCIIASRPMGDSRVHQWNVEGEQIRGQKQVDIPYSNPRELPTTTKQLAVLARTLGAQWRTVFSLQGVTGDRVIGLVDLDELEGDMLAKLGRGMRRRGTLVDVALIDERGFVTKRQIKPGEYAGEPLDVVELYDELCGRAVFTLYRAPKTAGRRRGAVEVMQLGSNAAVPWRSFRGQAMGARWLEIAKPAFDALGSGYFEGTIAFELVTLAKERDMFVLDDPLRAAFTLLTEWYDRYGQAYYEEERDARRDQRYVELGEKSLERLLGRLQGDPAFAAMVRGLVGSLPEPGRAPRTKPEPDPDASPRPRRRQPAVAERKRPEGNTPRPAGADATNWSIRFKYELMPDVDRLYVFDIKTGDLTFNILHPVWVALDETREGKHAARHDKQIMRLQEWLAFKVLLLISQYGPEGYALHQEEVDREVIFYAPLFCELEGRSS